MIKFPFGPEEYILLVFLISLLIQLCYYWLIFGRLAFFKQPELNTRQFPVSIVICSRNSSELLQENLPLILNQDYPNFEVVVVNDGSDDDTEIMLHGLTLNYPNLKIINLKQNINFFRGKKFPLSIGIKSAAHEYLLLTDADCKPRSDKWLAGMQQHFSENTEVVLGYSPYKKQKGILNLLIQYDTFFTAIQYLSFTLSGMPYMGVGRNLAYKKSLFLKSKGFTSHYKIQSGDDDLFINTIARKNNTCIAINPDTFIDTVAEETFISWYRQKKRHLTTGRFYRLSHKIVLGLYVISQFFYFASFILMLAIVYNIFIVFGLFLIRLISQIIIFKKCISKLHETNLLLFSPFIELFFMIFNPLLFFTGLVVKNNKWR